MGDKDSDQADPLAYARLNGDLVLVPYEEIHRNRSLRKRYTEFANSVPDEVSSAFTEVYGFATENWLSGETIYSDLSFYRAVRLACDCQQGFRQFVSDIANVAKSWPDLYQKFKKEMSAIEKVMAAVNELMSGTKQEEE